VQGVRVEQNLDAGVVITNTSLVLHTVNRHRTGNYSCTATNSEGISQSMPQTLTVLYIPECQPGLQTELRVSLHQQTEVSCTVTAEPATDISFRWLFRSSREEVDIQQSQVQVKGLTSVVDYVPRTAMDYGSLLCWAENELGTQAEPCKLELLPTTAPSPPHNCSLAHTWVSCKPGQDGGLPQTFHLLATDHLGVVVTNMSSPTPSFSMEGLKSGLSLALSASNSEGKTEGPRMTLEPAPGSEPQSGGPAQALPSLRTQGLRVTPLLGILIGVGAALGLLTLSLFLLLLCRSKRSPSSSASSCQAGQEEKERPGPDLITAHPEDKKGWSNRHENVYTVEPAYSCTGCPSYSSYATLQPRGHAIPPPDCSYSTLRPRRLDYSSVRRPHSALPEEAALLLPPLPPPSSHSSGIGSSGSDLDTSRGADCEQGETHRTDLESEV
jgi:hypothetical protein